MNPLQLERLLAQIIDGIDVEAIVAKCGGKGGTPGPCPDNKPDKPTGRQKPVLMPSAEARLKRSPEHQRLLEKHQAKFDGHLRAASHLSKQQQKRYQSAGKRVLNNMTEEGLDRLDQNLRSYYFYEDMDAVRAAYDELGEPSPYDLIGFYDESKQNLHLDGGPTGSPSIHKNYAHEFTHALDGDLRELSSSKEWQEAYQEEIVGGRLNWYADEGGPLEGLACFGEMMLTGDRRNARRRFPKCAKLWEEKWRL